MSYAHCCPLCLARDSMFFYKDRLRDYHRCLNCYLVYVPSQFHLNSIDEKKRYDLHQNHPDDIRYRQFLNKLLSAMLPFLSKGSKGLDFGSGPGPTLPLMFAELGFSMEIFDPFYANNKEILDNVYDFVSSSETVEHFRKPKQEWELLFSLVKNNGLIGIMTQLLLNDCEFSSWYYKNDDTHICFYSKETCSWLAQRYASSVRFFKNSVVLFWK